MRAIHSDRWCRRFVALAATLAVIHGGLRFTNAAAPQHPVVPGFDRIYSSDNADVVEGGRLLLTELNCVSCHKAEGAAATLLRTKQAPILDAVGNRVEIKWLQNYLTSVHAAKAGTTMPDLFAGLDVAAREQQVTALTHFLAQTGSVADAMGDSSAVVRGERLFHTIGCVACHAPIRDGVETPANSVPLGAIADKYSLTSLTEFVKNPLKVRPSGRMPNFKLDDKQARDIASFFFRDKKIAANVNFAYYEGGWQKLPDFSTLKPKSEGQSSGFDLSIRQKNDGFAFRFTGFIHIPKDGEYRFLLGSDDGSRLVIDGNQVIINDDVHPHTVKEGRTKLTSGVHEVVVEYFEGGGEETLTVEIQGAGLSPQPLASITTPTREIPKKEVDGDVFVLDDTLAKQGQKLFASIGCASCHSLKRDNQLVKSTDSAKKLAELSNLEAGCLGAAPTKGVPHYRLSDAQRSQLAAALKELQTTAEDTPEKSIHRTLAQFNCFACHARNKVGGVDEARNAFFTSTMKEMGDEGRIPPALDGVADKLTEKWLKSILENGSRDRPYMLTTMPQFGGRNVGHLQAALQDVDQRTEVEFPDYELPDSKMKAIGRRLAGEKGLGCIKCHTFDKFKATGIQSIDLTIMSERLRKDWFHRYMANPQKYRAGTRMPAPWPFGQATIRDVLDVGNVEQQVAQQKESVWLFLSDGKKAGIPTGLNKGGIVLKPETTPIIYRNFIEGVSPRGIAVGYPEGVHLCFDADQISLALIWENDFIDASKHWNGRGQGFQPPLGDNVYDLVRGVPFATLENADATWPTEPAAKQGYRFLGYRFNSSRQPIFRYSKDRIVISDAIVPRKNDKQLASFERTIALESPSPVARMFFRAASASKIESVDGGFVLDGHLKLTLSAESSKSAIIRQSGGKTELLIPVTFANGRAEITQLYEW
ncbi:MAG: c-type cytochrome [Planctomycetales bacterium]|jgi:mono/diheme cytochrome c family protein